MRPVALALGMLASTAAFGQVPAQLDTEASDQQKDTLEPIFDLRLPGRWIVTYEDADLGQVAGTGYTTLSSCRKRSP